MQFCFHKLAPAQTALSATIAGRYRTPACLSPLLQHQSLRRQLLQRQVGSSSTAAMAAAAVPVKEDAMVWSFTVQHKDGAARTGVLETRRGTIETPNILIYTRRGGPLSLTPDMLQHLRPMAQCLQMNTLHFLEHPSPDRLEAFGGGVHALTAHQDTVIYAGSRDPCAYEHGLRPSSDQAAYVTIHSGGIMVTPALYMRVVAALKPDFYVALSDEITSGVGKKRVLKSIDRTTKWLDECLKEHESRELASCSAVFAPVQGGGIVEERSKSAKAASERDVQGFVLCGFGTGELPSQRPQLLAAAMEPLPRDKPVLVSGLGLPAEILQGIEAGADLFDVSLVTALVEAGCALCLPVEPSVQASTAEEHSVEEGADDTKLNLWSTAYRLDARPLVPGCSCWTCRNHSRAYIHHLLNVHEMLAGTLLEMHNTHQMLAFMQAARTAIQEQRFDQFKQLFTGS